MIRALYTSISGMITQEAKQDVITNNLANANTTGFKSDNLTIKKFDDVLIQNYDKKVGNNNVQNIIGSLSNGSRIDEVYTNYTQGSMETTDSPTDFALEGSGFFAVQRDNGIGNSTFYTRNGQFHVNMKGILVNDSGDSVLARDTNNNITTINAGSSKITSDSLGNISLDGVQKYKLEVVDFADYNKLKKSGDNLYMGTNPIQNTNASIKQNSLERSNVNITNEIVNMMTTMRSFETNQKIVKSIDETLNKAVNEVGTVR